MPSGVCGSGRNTRAQIVGVVPRTDVVSETTLVFFVEQLPTGSSQKFVKTKMFPKGVDLREKHGAVGLRALKNPALAQAVQADR